MEVVPKKFNQAKLKEFVDRCRRKRGIFATSKKVPISVLEGARMWDMKVDTTHGSDDWKYTTDSEIRETIHRGNAIIEHFGENGKEYHVGGFGVKKYGGGCATYQDNKRSDEWMIYKNGSLEHVTKYAITDKPNGEVAHVSFPIIKEENLFAIGSKNVHILLRNEHEIDNYPDEFRYNYAKTIARVFFATYWNNDGIPIEEKHNLRKRAQEGGFTAVFEILNPETQHIVDLSDKKSPEMLFICFSAPMTLAEDYVKGESSLIPVPVHIAIDEAREKYGLPTIGYEIKHVENGLFTDLATTARQIRSGNGFEGKVLYLMDQNDKTIALIKVKTAWYTMRRGLRSAVENYFEKIGKGQKLDCTLKQLVKRNLSDKEWLGATDKFMSSWNTIGEKYAEWIQKTCSPSEALADLKLKYPATLTKFFEQDDAAKILYDETLDEYPLKNVE